MQPFGLAGAEQKATERKPLALKALALERLALKASAQGQPRLREDETGGEET